MCACVKSLYMSGFHQLRGLRLHPLGVQVAGFRLPLNARGPIVMVAAGTGLAPMRGFLHSSEIGRPGRANGPSVWLPEEV